MTPADVLLRAADRVQFKGWNRFAYALDADGKMVAAKSPKAVSWCARGALKAEGANRHQFSQTVDAVETSLSLEEYEWSLMTWNDQPGRTAGEVADTMRRVAKELSNEARP